MQEDKHLLILDLDETLIHASDSILQHPPHHQLPPHFIYLRPGLSEFLKQAELHYRLAVWTSASLDYAHAICSIIFTDKSTLEFIWASNRCTPRRNFDLDTWSNTKSLHKVKRQGYNLEKTLVVDDSPEKHTKNYGNLIRVRAFEGDPNDDELYFLSDYLLRLANEPNVRKIEKRGWRQAVAT